MANPAHRISFGIKTSQLGVTYQDISTVWRAADEIEAIEHAWLWDHMLPMRGDPKAATLEAWTLLAALAAQTSRLRLGVLVTSNRLRLPTLLAKMAATVDIVSGGRLDFGIGTGGFRTAGENPGVREYGAYGVPLVSASEAISDLDQALSIIRRMWTESDPFDFDGPSITLHGAVCEPKPVQQPRPPIMIGGWGDRVLRVVAEHADSWNFPWPDAERFRLRAKQLDTCCETIGRSPAEIERSVQVIVRADHPDEPAATVRLLGELIDAGATHFVLAPMLGDRPLSWLVDNVVEPVLAR